jgi:hypothetical protein
LENIPPISLRGSGLSADVIGGNCIKKGRGKGKKGRNVKGKTKKEDE